MDSDVVLPKDKKWDPSGRVGINRHGSTKKEMDVEMCTSKMLETTLSNEKTMPFLEACPTLMTYDEIKRTKEYRRVIDRACSTVHNGQLKLFLTEVQFLSNYCEDINEEVYVIYAGSAPGNKNIYLSELFPNIKFIFVDPNEHFFKMGSKNQYTSPKIMDRILYFSVSKLPFKFDFKRKIPKPHNIHLYGKGKVERDEYKDIELPDNIGELILKDTTHTIFVIEDFFTAELSKNLSSLKNSGKRVFFISDIRTNLRGNVPDEDGEVSPTNGDILWNSAQMFSWLSILQPHYFMLKFRCPFGYKDSIDNIRDNEDIKECKKEYNIDFIKNYEEQKFIFIKPHRIFLQAYAGVTSTETRLVASYPFELHSFDTKEYEDRFFYYNNIIRSYGWHSIPQVFLDKYRMIDRCGDCAIMSRIIMDYKLWTYKNKPQPAQNIIEKESFAIVETLLDLLERRRLITNQSIHGNYYFQYSSSEMFRLHQESLCRQSNDYLLRYDMEKGDTQFTVENGKYYLEKIFSSMDLRKNRNNCIIQKLFGIKKQYSQSKDIRFIKNPKGGYSIETSKDSRRELKYRNILFPNQEDILFSRDIIQENSPIIEDAHFYEKMETFLKMVGIKNIHIILSSRCDFLFTDEFYQRHRSQIKIYSLANRSAYNFCSLKEDSKIDPNDVIIVQIKEDPSVHFHLRKILIEKYRRSIIFFLEETDQQIYKKSYIKANYEKYVHVESVNCSEEWLATDVDIDKHIKYFIKGLPYVFRSKLCEDCSSDVKDRYGNCERLYLLPEKLLDSFSFMLKVEDRYFLNWEESRLMCICFSGKDIVRDDFFKIRIDGIPIHYPMIESSLVELYTLDKDSMTLQEFYEASRISIPEEIREWKTVHDVISTIQI